MRDPFANYDAWKLATPPEYDLPDPPEELSECCSALRHPDFETDICSECKEHATFSAEADYREMHETVECGSCGSDYGRRCDLPPDTLRAVSMTVNFKWFTHHEAYCHECKEICEVTIVLPEPNDD